MSKWWQNLLGIETRSEGNPYGSGPLPGVIPPSRSGVAAVTLDRALSIPAVYRAIQILAVSVSQLEWGAYRNGEEVLPSPALIRRPDVDRPLSNFLKRTTIDLAGTGNAYWRIYRNPDSTVATLRVLNPKAVGYEYDDNGRKWWLYSDNRDPSQKLAYDKVKHLRLMEVPGHDDGVGPIEANASSLRSILNLKAYVDNWFVKSGVPVGGVLATDQQLDPVEANELADAWTRFMEERGFAVTGKGLKWEATMLKPADAQYLEIQKFFVTEVARMFGIPAPFLLAEIDSNSLTYQNLEMVDTQFIRTALMDYLTEIEEAMSDLLVRGQVAQFKVDSLLRPDARTQADIHKTYSDLGVLSAKEIRKQKGWAGDPPPKPKPQPVGLQATDPANAPITKEDTGE